MVFSLFSLTEVFSKGSHFAIKERGTQKHTQSVKRHHRQPAADRNSYFVFIRCLPLKSKNVIVKQFDENFSLEKQMVFHFFIKTILAAGSPLKVPLCYHFVW